MGNQIKEPIISIREYSRRRGCSDALVGKKIKEGKIVKGVAKNAAGKNIGIYQSIADKEWEESFNPNYNRNPNIQRQFSGEPAEPTQVLAAAGSGATLNQAKTAKAVFDAKLAQLEYEEKSKTLVKKEKVYNQLFAVGQQIRDALTAIPARITDDILAAPTRVEAMNLLQKEINEVLTKVADMTNIGFK